MGFLIADNLSSGPLNESPSEKEGKSARAISASSIASLPQ